MKRRIPPFPPGAHFDAMIGCDESGRGPAVGPVCAASLWFDPAVSDGLLALLDDSKRLSESQRQRAFDAMLIESGRGLLKFAVGCASAKEIDRLNILEASLLAMRRSVEKIGRIMQIDGVPCAFDGLYVPRNLPLSLGQKSSVIGGDRKIPQIAGASIVAKIYQSRLMLRLDMRWPGYDLASNSGYPTARHIDGLARLGPTPHHRRSFSCVSSPKLF